MAKWAYTVTASLPDESVAEGYVAWLLGGHVQDVVTGGAERAEVVRLEGEGEIRVESRYVFPDREAYERYLSEHAPRLREEGLRRFGPGTGVRFERAAGEVLGSPPGVPLSP